MTEESLENVRTTWQPFYEETLTLEDAANISHRLNVFFQLLQEGKQTAS